jgi:hypothetical protein
MAGECLLATLARYVLASELEGRNYCLLRNTSKAFPVGAHDIVVLQVRLGQFDASMPG